MAPVETQFDRRSAESIGKPIHPDGLILEAWAQGFMVGALIVMSCVTVANMRKGVILHKLILTELILGTFHGTFIFPHPPVYGWYLSVTAVALNTSWSLHNVIAWIKNKPFLSSPVSRFYITTVALAQIYWIIEIYANFAYFNNYNKLFLKTRPLEALFRDPWWIWTCSSLLYNIHTQYSLSLCTIIRASPRFGLLLGSMLLSVLFLLIDIAAVVGAFNSTVLPDGLNPWWKLSFCFKCLTDTLVLDDFKTALDRLWRARNRQKERRKSLLTDAGKQRAELLIQAFKLEANLSCWTKGSDGQVLRV
ncbi:hypothetical protein IWZ03DRAFT_396586 [Phyllosticta citriasiana]|uniref:Uncharacterized protein n=2 Tax=Phyllosticta citriasiana TaxID=595635 RepID=A0ABR1KD88_9PEZI